jgi:integrase
MRSTTRGVGAVSLSGPAYPLMLLAGNSGLRRGELAGLRCSDIGLATGQLMVRQQHKSIRYLSKTVTRLMRRAGPGSPMRGCTPCGNQDNQDHHLCR